MAGCEGEREDGQLSHSKPGSHHHHHHHDNDEDDDAGIDDDADADDDYQAVRAAIEKMAEEGEVYTGVFTQVIDHQCVLLLSMMRMEVMKMKMLMRIVVEVRLGGIFTPAS